MARPLTPRTSVATLGQFDPRILEHFAQPIHFARPIADLLHLIPGDIPQLANRGRRHKARLQQAAFEQLRQPLAILDIGLPPRHVLQLPHVDQQQLKRVLKHVVDRLPIDARTFQRHMRHPRRLQPVTQRDQIRGHRPEGLRTARPVAVGARRPDGRDHRRFVHIQSRHAINHWVHGVSSARSEERGLDDSARRARSNNTGCLNAPASDFVRTCWYQSLRRRPTARVDYPFFHATG
jgi:hypothetical protein